MLKEKKKILLAFFQLSRLLGMQADDVKWQIKVDRIEQKILFVSSYRRILETGNRPRPFDRLLWYLPPNFPPLTWLLRGIFNIGILRQVSISRLNHTTLHHVLTLFLILQILLITSSARIVYLPSSQSVLIDQFPPDQLASHWLRWPLREEETSPHYLTLLT